MSPWIPKATLAAAAVALSLPAEAHLMAPRQATVHMVGPSAYSVVWLPASALRDADTDGDGRLSAAELERGYDALVEHLATRWTLRDGAGDARVVRIDLIPQPPDDAPPGSAADSVVMLHHARFAGPPREVELATDLFGAGTAEISVGASSEHGAERATLHGPAARHRFFAASAAPAATRHTLALALALGALLVGLGALARRRRS